MKEIAEKFRIEGDIVSIEPLGNGLINDTYRITTAGNSPDYVLQSINNAIFTDVDLLQRNIEAVTSHIRRKLQDAGQSDIERKVLRFIPLKESDRTWCCVDGKYFRVSVFIPDAYSYETVDPHYSRLAGQAFGNFESMLSDIREPIGETIPDFHNIELRIRQLRQAAAEDRAGRMKDPECTAILEDMMGFSDEMCRSERLYREGVLPKRICHCDTKVNNMLFDRDGNVLCVIDLDTVMPGFVFSDFGDFMRTAANFTAEDDPAIEKVGLNMEIFKAFTEGYLSGTGEFLTRVEKANLPYAACLFPYMQAVRFFADYLNGDTYYKIRYPEHNLVRTRNQMALFHDAMEKVPQMEAFIGR